MSYLHHYFFLLQRYHRFDGDGLTRAGLYAISSIRVFISLYIWETLPMYGWSAQPWLDLPFDSCKTHGQRRKVTVDCSDRRCCHCVMSCYLNVTERDIRKRMFTRDTGNTTDVQLCNSKRHMILWMPSSMTLCKWQCQWPYVSYYYSYQIWSDILLCTSHHPA